jgi:hypothetical protein
MNAWSLCRGVVLVLALVSAHLVAAAALGDAAESTYRQPHGSSSVLQTTAAPLYGEQVQPGCDLPPSAPMVRSGRDDITPEWVLVTERPVLSSPRFADVDGDGTEEVVLSTYAPPPDQYSAGFVFVLDIDGQDLPAWPIETDACLPASPR